MQYCRSTTIITVKQVKVMPLHLSRKLCFSFNRDLFGGIMNGIQLKLINAPGQGKCHLPEELSEPQMEGCILCSILPLSLHIHTIINTITTALTVVHTLL